MHFVTYTLKYASCDWVEILGLDRPRLREFRELWIRIVRLAALCDPALHQRLLSYPADLPDLSTLRPPEGNTRPNPSLSDFRY